jgi:hypothetical protein
MKNIIIAFVTISAILSSCSNSYKYGGIEKFINNRKLFDKADYNFPDGYQYYRLKNFNLRTLSNTLSKCHEEIFQDSRIVELINKDITAWLRDSVFIGSSKTMEGTFVLDTTNIFLMNNSVGYTLSTISQPQKMYNEIFQMRHSMHTARIDGKEIYYDIIPTNGNIIKKLAEYRIETTGDYIPSYMHAGGKVNRSDLKYFCDLYLIDWYIVISSDDFFDDRLAIKITDTTYYYHSM